MTSAYLTFVSYSPCVHVYLTQLYVRKNIGIYMYERTTCNMSTLYTVLFNSYVQCATSYTHRTHIYQSSLCYLLRSLGNCKAELNFILSPNSGFVGAVVATIAYHHRSRTPFNGVTSWWCAGVMVVVVVVVDIVVAIVSLSIPLTT